MCAAHSEGPPLGRLLTTSEYAATVRDLLGETSDPTEDFPNEPEVNGYDNDARAHVANPVLVERFLGTGEVLAKNARARGMAALGACVRRDDECLETFLRAFGRRAFRRPLTDVERTTFLELYAEVERVNGHEDALEALVSAFLQSPQFLYRFEAPLPDDGAPENRARLLTSFEVASRLSYFLWGSAPDDELLDAAEAGALDERDGLRAEAARLLDDPRARPRIREFFHRWLGLGPLPTITRNEAPPGFGPALLASLEHFVDQVFWNGGTLEDLLTSPYLALEPPLASFYRSHADERAGLLTHPALLALFAHPNQTSPIARGVFVRSRLLCAPVSPPPPGVDNNPPDPAPGLTTRELFRVHTEDPSCAACHRLLDPIGFGFERYDHLGRFRDTESGKPVDASGAFVETGDPILDGDFTDEREMLARLVESPRVTECLARNLLTFALGATPDDAAECSLDSLAESRGSLRSLLLDVVTSYAFRYRAPLTRADFPSEAP